MEESYKFNYSNDFMIDRLVSKLKDQDNGINQSLFKVPKPIVYNNNRKTFFSNFYSIVKGITYDEEDFDINYEGLKKHIQSELKISGSINDKNELVIVPCLGKEAESRVKFSVKTYIDKNIKCKSCGCCITKNIKEKRIKRILCLKCNSKSNK